MNKAIYTFLIFGLAFFTACNSNNKNTKATKGEEADLIETANESDLEFKVALQAFTKGDKATTAEYIETAVSDLQEESSELDVNAKAKVEQSIATLKILATQIRNGEIKDLKTVENAFVKAEMLLAHEYLIFSSRYLVEEPDDALTSLQVAVEKLKNAVQKMEGASKAEAEAMLEEGEAILKTFDMQADEIGNKIEKLAEKLGNWLERNAVGDW